MRTIMGLTLAVAASFGMSSVCSAADGVVISCEDNCGADVSEELTVTGNRTQNTNWNQAGQLVQGLAVSAVGLSGADGALSGSAKGRSMATNERVEITWTPDGTIHQVIFTAHGPLAVDAPQWHGGVNAAQP
jgi:hypothetical protein